MNWKEIRSNYPLVDNCTYLDTARTGAISKGTAERLKVHIDDMLQNGAFHREEWIKVMESTRNRSANLLSVSSGEIGFLTDLSVGMNILASAMTDKKRVLLVEGEFPSVGIPWIKKGYEIQWISRDPDFRIDLNKIETELKKGIDILPISWVQYNSGFRVNLKTLGALCQKYGTKLLVDGTQGICAYPVEPKDCGVDVFMASAFKWMTAGFGISIIYMDQEFRNSMKVSSGGWNSLVDFFGSWEKAENFKSGSAVVEMGHPKYANLYCLDNALKEMESIGLENIQQRTAHMSGYLQGSLHNAGIETLSNFAPEESSAIRLMRGSKALFNHLSEHDVRLTFREDYFRVAPHFYNDEGDVDRLIEGVLGVDK